MANQVVTLPAAPGGTCEVAVLSQAAIYNVTAPVGVTAGAVTVSPALPTRMIFPLGERDGPRFVRLRT